MIEGRDCTLKPWLSGNLVLRQSTKGLLVLLCQLRYRLQVDMAPVDIVRVRQSKSKAASVIVAKDDAKVDAKQTTVRKGKPQPFAAQGMLQAAAGRLQPITTSVGTLKPQGKLCQGKLSVEKKRKAENEADEVVEVKGPSQAKKTPTKSKPSWSTTTNSSTNSSSKTKKLKTPKKTTSNPRKTALPLPTPSPSPPPPPTPPPTSLL